LKASNQSPVTNTKKFAYHNLFNNAVVIEEVNPENVAVGGKLIADRRSHD